MQVRSVRCEGILILSLEGRLDAQGALELEASLKEGISETDRVVVWNMEGVSFLSSAGIRTIVALEKTLKARKGVLLLYGVQPHPQSVLDLTGFSTLLSLYASHEEALQAAHSIIATSFSTVQEAIRLQTRGAEYQMIPTGSGPTSLDISGYPAMGKEGCMIGEPAIPVTIPLNGWSFGWGSLSQENEDLDNEIGDLITLGQVAVWLPANSDIPDYLIVDRRKRGIPISTPFLISAAGPSQYIVKVQSASPEGIPLSDLLEGLAEAIRGKEPAYQGVLGLSFWAMSPQVYTLDPSAGDTSRDLMNPLSMNYLIGCAVHVDPLMHPAHFQGAVADLLVRSYPFTPTSKPWVEALIFRDLPWPEGSTISEVLAQSLSIGSSMTLCHLSTRTRIRKAMLEVSVIRDIGLHTGLKIVLEKKLAGWNPEYEKIVRLVHHDCSEVRLHPISGGYSGSLVLQDEAYDCRSCREMPFVLKLDRWNNIQTEVRGYEEHVKRYIQNNATQIIQYSRSGEYGGILYTFVGIQGGQSRIFSLEEYYLSHSTEEVLEVFDLLFRKVLRAWYGQPRLRDLALYQIYKDIYNYLEVKRWAESRYGITSNDEFIELPHNMGRSTNPIYFMEQILPQRLSEKWSVYEGSVHGDLNLRNVLMDKEQNLWLIDFAMTEHSHILRDIAKLESVLKMEMIPLPSDDRLLTLLELEKVFLSPQRLGEIPEIPTWISDPEVLKPFKLVRQLRRYADAITLLDDDIRQYWLALFHYTLCVPAYMSVNDRMREYAWISSSLLCQSLK